MSDMIERLRKGTEHQVWVMVDETVDEIKRLTAIETAASRIAHYPDIEKYVGTLLHDRLLSALAVDKGDV